MQAWGDSAVRIIKLAGFLTVSLLLIWRAATQTQFPGTSAMDAGPVLCVITAVFVGLTGVVWVAQREDGEGQGEA